LSFWRDNHEAATAEGALLKKVAGGLICDRRDAVDVQQEAAAGSGERSFDELGFAAGSAFAVRDDAGQSRLVLTAAGAFSIEAVLAAP
jgi:hypothetical protein